MSKVTVYNLKGESVGEIALAPEVFGVTPKPSVVQFVVRAQRANAHVPYGHSKRRGQVSGGGRKPWKQKGTGRARQGSIRAPQWKGGGVNFGPNSERNMTMKVNKSTRHTALRMVLSDKVNDQLFLVVDSFDGVEGKSKQLATAIKSLPVKTRTALIATAQKQPLLQRAARNVVGVNTLLVDSLNVVDLLKYRFVLLDKAGVERLTATLQ